MNARRMPISLRDDARGTTWIVAALVACLTLPSLAGRDAPPLAAAADAAGYVRLRVAAPLTTTATPGGFVTADPSSYPTRPTPTRLPTLDPTPKDGPIVVGAPLPTPALAADAITARTALDLVELKRLVPPVAGWEGAVSFSPDAKVMYTIYGADRLVARSTQDGEIGWTATGGVSRTTWPRVAVSPDGRTLATTGYTGLVLVDAATGFVLRSESCCAGGEIAFADGGRQLAVLRRAGYAAAWDVATGALLADREVARDAGVSAHLRPGTAEVSAVTWRVNALVVRDILTGGERWSSPPPAGTGGTTGGLTWWSPNGRFVGWPVADGRLASGQWMCRSDLSALPTCVPLTVHPISTVAFGPPAIVHVSNHGLVVMAGERHSHPGVCQTLGIDVWDGERSKRSLVEWNRRNVDSVDVSPDGSLLAVTHTACDGDADVRTSLIALDRGLVVADLAGVHLQGFSPDGRRFVAGAIQAKGGGLRLYGVVPGSGVGRRAWLPVVWAGR